MTRPHVQQANRSETATPRSVELLLARELGRLIGKQLAARSTDCRLPTTFAATKQPTTESPRSH
jgi:hypothetical protein